MSLPRRSRHTCHLLRIRNILNMKSNTQNILEGWKRDILKCAMIASPEYKSDYGLQDMQPKRIISDG